MNTNNYDVVIETMRIKQVQLTKSRHDPSYCSLSHKDRFYPFRTHIFGVRCLFNMIFTNTSHRITGESLANDEDKYPNIEYSATVKKSGSSFSCSLYHPRRYYRSYSNPLTNTWNVCSAHAKFLHLDVFK